jgi:DNA primase
MLLRLFSGPERHPRMGIPNSFIQELLARVDCVEVVGRHVQLKKAGANYLGLCPFHGEKSPSFTVSPAKQFYHCFGCGKNGSAIGFLMDHLGQSFVEAVQDLAGSIGLQVPQEHSSPQDAARAAQQKAKSATLVELMDKAAQAYQMSLRASERGAGYFKKRGVSGEVAKRYGLGYAPEGRSNLAGVFANYQDPMLVECGLVIEREDEGGGNTRRYDRFRDRVMFPIRNVKGETIGFGGRILDQGEPKYLNSPETPLFSKGRELYGLWEARDPIRKAGHVLVTEGYMDVVALAQMGFGHAVATLGTACTPDHVHKLFRFTDSVVFSFDGDSAGRKAARKALDGALPYATDTRNVKFLFLPPEHDPDSFIRELGAEAFGHAVAQATPLSRFLLDACRQGCDMDSAEGRAQFLANAQPLWKLLPEGALRIQLLSDMATLGNLSAAGLKDLWGLNAPPPSAGQRSGQRGGAPGLTRYQEYSGKGNEYGYNRGKSFQKPGFGERSGSAGGLASPLGGTARGQGISRQDLLARLALLQHSLLEPLSSGQWATLTQLPEPHGPLFAWLEAQLHNMGPQPWAALREGLRMELDGSAANALAQRLMAADQLNPSSEQTQTDEQAEATAKALQTAQREEFADALRRLTIDTLKTQETQAIQAASRDPQALERYRALSAERRVLESALARPG